MSACKGCLFKKDCDVYMMNNKYIEICPCTKCIVSIVCKESCPEYNKFMHTIYNDRKFIEEMIQNKRPMKISEKPNILREVE